MKKVEMTQVKVIDATSGFDFEQQFNTSMRELSSFNPTFEATPGLPWAGKIFYRVKSDPIPESLADEFKLAGKRMQCVGCPYFFMNEDKRMKARCLLHSFIVEPNRECCEEYLAEVIAKEGHPGKGV